MPVRHLILVTSLLLAGLWLGPHSPLGQMSGPRPQHALGSHQPAGAVGADQAAGLPSGAAHAPADAVADAATDPGPLTSALVGIEGPSVYQQLMGRQLGARVTGMLGSKAVWAALADPAASEALGLGPAATDALDLDALAGVDVKAIEAGVLRGQAPVIAAAKRLGVQVISRYAASANGLLVHATRGQLQALGQVPGVRFVERAPLVTPQLKMSVPHIGATRLAKEKGYDGTGAVVAIIDTGVDYTHGHLGGPGTKGGWDAANLPGMGEVITDTYEGKLLYPNDKVIGGWDFVGPNYDPPHICLPPMMAAGQCTNVPEPDPDPLDASGHGTHVSGIVAGHGSPLIGDGVAPGAKLVGLKLYGTGGADEAADVLVDAVEWTARVNLKLETRGVLPPQVNGINCSLGEDFAQGSRLFDEAVASAVGTGIVFASSAGNSGDEPFVQGAPSASPKILSIASSVPPQMTLLVKAMWAGGEAEYPASESSIAVPLAQAGKIEAEMTWFGRGCTGDAQAQDVKEKIALVARGVCNFSEKLLNAQAAGAIAVLMYSDLNRPRNTMGGDGTGILIPSVMVDTGPGLELQAKLEAGTVVRVLIDGSNIKLDNSSADAISGFSSRGPSKNGALKPDISAPGTGIFSSSMGGGMAGVSLNGTSMAGPHVAGAGALVHHRNNAEKLGLSGAELAALLMNYANPVVWNGAADQLVPVVRQGAGEVDLWRSGTANLLIRTGDIASVNLGPLAFTKVQRLERPLTLKNLSGTPMWVKLDSYFQYPSDRDQGVSIELPSAPVEVEGKGSTTVMATFVVDPARLRAWNLRQVTGSFPNALTALEVDGYLTLTPVDAQGAPIAAQPVATVPYYALPRRASAIKVDRLPAAKADTSNQLVLRNSSPFSGTAEIFVAPVDSRTGKPSEDPDEKDVTYELDIRRVGVRYEPAADPTQAGMLAFGMATYETAAVPRVTQLEVYVDTNRDGLADYRVRDGLRAGRMATFLARWDPINGTITGTETTTGTLNVSDLHTHLRTLSVPLSALGLTAPQPIDFYVVHRGLNEDWLFTAETDVAPDGADAPGGPRYRFNAADLARVPDRWSTVVEGAEGVARIPLTRGPGEWDPTWLALYIDDDFAAKEGQIQVVMPGEKPASLFLPKVLSGFEMP